MSRQLLSGQLRRPGKGGEAKDAVDRERVDPHPAPVMHSPGRIRSARHSASTRTLRPSSRSIARFSRWSMAGVPEGIPALQAPRLRRRACRRPSPPLEPRRLQGEAPSRADQGDQAGDSPRPRPGGDRPGCGVRFQPRTRPDQRSPRRHGPSPGADHPQPGEPDASDSAVRDGYVRGLLPRTLTARQVDVMAAFAAAGGSVAEVTAWARVRPSTAKRLAGLRA